MPITARQDTTNSWVLAIASFLVILIIWSLLHWHFRETVIFHDNWIHNYPIVYALARSSGCGQLAYWLMSPDTGAPSANYSISVSLTQPFRALLINVFACTRPGPFKALLLYKAHVYFLYVGLAVGMFVLGRTLLRHWVSAVYLGAATLFAGLCLDTAHSDQVAIIIFWVPWFVCACVLADQNAGQRVGSLYLNLAALFFCVALLDQYPHFAVLAGATAGMFYATFRLDRLRLMVTQWRQLWPAMVLFTLTTMQLFIISSKIGNYVPSLRAALTVDPSQFGETGFVQPSALFGVFFPLTFTTAFEKIGSGFGPLGSRNFIFHLDILIFYFGTIPLFLIVSWFSGVSQRYLKCGWAGFTAILFLVSLQQSRLYYLLFHLPFFDLFRSYFLFIAYVIFGLLVMSAYGFDQLVIQEPGQRFDRLRLTLRFGLYAIITSAVVFGIVIWWSGLGTGIFAYVWPMAGDILMIGAAIALFWWWRAYPGFHTGHGLVVFVALIVTQSLYAAAIYQTLGITAHTAFESYKLDSKLLTPYSPQDFAQPSNLRRGDCPTFGSCYLALRDVASLRQDLDGTFLRHRLNPVFQKDLSPAAKAALTGVTQPFFWASTSLQPVPSIVALNDALNGDSAKLVQRLSRMTYLIGFQAGIETQTPKPAQVSLTNLQRGVDHISFQYRSEGPAIINVGITYDPHWTGRVNGRPVTLMSGDYGILSLWVTSGSGTIELRYRDLASRLFFWSRYLLTGLAVIAALSIAWLVWFRRSHT
jgi:hypothetical protein